jgi:hypothetical protein
MKTKMKRLAITMIAIACTLGASASMQARPSDNARLIVKRSAAFGVNESINVAVDGVRVAALGINQSYDAALSPGTHIVSITTNPKTYGGRPNQFRVNAEPGRSYTLTAVWDDAERASLVEQ